MLWICIFKITRLFFHISSLFSKCTQILQFGGEHHHPTSLLHHPFNINPSSLPLNHDILISTSILNSIPTPTQLSNPENNQRISYCCHTRTKNRKSYCCHTKTSTKKRKELFYAHGQA